MGSVSAKHLSEPEALPWAECTGASVRTFSLCAYWVMWAWFAFLGVCYAGAEMGFVGLAGMVACDCKLSLLYGNESTT